MKKGILLLLALVLLLSACTGAESKKPVEAAFCSGMNTPSQAFAGEMFEKHMGEYGFQFTLLDDQGDAGRQAENIRRAAAEGYRWIVVNPSDAVAIASVLESVREEYPDVILSTFSSDFLDNAKENRDFFVGINDFEVGVAAANEFLAMFPSGCRLVEIGGHHGHSAQTLRHLGFLTVMSEHPEFELLDVQNAAQWDAENAKAIAEDMLERYGDQIDGVYCHWDGGVTGVLEAFQAAGKSAAILGVDGSGAGFRQIREGRQFATILNDFEQICCISMSAAKRMLEGEQVASEQYIQTSVVTLDNMDHFTEPSW